MIWGGGGGFGHCVKRFYCNISYRDRSMWTVGVAREIMRWAFVFRMWPKLREKNAYFETGEGHFKSQGWFCNRWSFILGLYLGYIR